MLDGLSNEPSPNEPPARATTPELTAKRRGTTPLVAKPELRYVKHTGRSPRPDRVTRMPKGGLARLDRATRPRILNYPQSGAWCRYRVPRPNSVISPRGSRRAHRPEAPLRSNEQWRRGLNNPTASIVPGCCDGRRARAAVRESHAVRCGHCRDRNTPEIRRRPRGLADGSTLELTPTTEGQSGRAPPPESAHSREADPDVMQTTRMLGAAKMRFLRRPSDLMFLVLARPSNGMRLTRGGGSHLSTQLDVGRPPSGPAAC